MRKEIGWGNGCSTLFLAPAEDGGFVLYDYEFDYEKIHQLCGGMNYYQSRSGDTGEGYITKLDELIKVGFYRVDTKYNDFQFPEDIGNGYSMMLPYATHMEYKDTILAQNPVVIKDGNRIIFCSYYDNMCEIVMNLFTQQKLEKSPRILKRNFYDVEYDETYEQEIMFYNMFGYCRQYPWEFCKEYLKRFECEEYENERLHSLFNIVEKDGNLYTTTRIAGRKYYTGVLKENTFADLKEDFCNQHGWKLEDGIIYKYKEKDVFVFGFVDYSALYKKMLQG